MSEHDRLVERLGDLVGIGRSYRDAFGKEVETSPDSRRAILSGFGLDTGTEAAARDSLARVEAVREALLPPLLPARSGTRPRVPVRAPRGAQAVWRLTDESGGGREGRALLGATDEGGILELPPLAAGYHRLEIEADGRSAAALLVAAPAHCFEPEPIRQGAKLWGVTAQLYALRSERNFGIGDYTDVARAAGGAGGMGASFLGLSPVHALFAADRTKISPYSPSSRLFLETLFIDPTRVDGFEGSEAARLWADGDLQARLATLREGPLIDHAASWELKRPLLEALWADFRRAGSPAFDAFRREAGEALDAHATFEALSEHFRREERYWLGDWPEAFRRRDSDAVRRFAAENGERVGYHAWLQWIADRQLAQAHGAARGAGMGIGLYRDLAVGADRGGSEIWAHPDRFAATLSIGAPPDLLGPQGQNWGLPPFNPLALEAQGLAAFRAMVSANMRHAGAIRIDHAFQLQRLFLIPPGASAAEGAYVAYPFEAILAVLRLESRRARCLVIAEDLGTGPEGFSDAIMGAGIYSYRVLPFEREHDGAFKRPRAYPDRALAVVTTHDLPTFRGWWRGLDVDLRQTHGIYDVEASERERVNRDREREQLAEALAEEDLLPSAEPPTEPPLEASIAYLARTPSALVGIQLEDAGGELNQANMPGPDTGHPNWRRRLTRDIEDIVAPGGDLAKLGAVLAREGRGERPRASPLASPPPRATYRLQFHRDFTFDDAAAIVPYLAALGISHVYASPIHKARPGSTHGYDIVDHAAINPELGGEEGFVRLSDALKEHGLGLLLDIVPNHMGVGGADNGWWLSVLEWGEQSPHGAAFDIDWERLGAHHKLVVPFLGERYGEALENGNLKLAFDPDEGSFSIWHWEHRFPITPLSYPIVLDRALAVLGDLSDPPRNEMLAVSARLRAMGEETAPERRAAFPTECEELKRRLAAAVAESPALAEAVGRAVDLINGAAGIPESFDTLHRILEMQAYRLAHWRVAASDINYRRFFDINSLGGLRVEDPEVFARTHEKVFELVRERRVDGLRIDHIDGLADPEGYAHALQGAVGPGFYVLVEKILEPGETLRPWPISGTTGYDVLNLIDGVMIDASAAAAFERVYRRAGGLDGAYPALLRRAKREILETSFASELEVLVSDLKRIADADRRTRDYTVFAMRRALVEIIGRFPVYRSYIVDDEPDPDDRHLIEETVAAAKRTSVLPDRTVHDFVAAALLGAIETEGPGRPAPEHLRRFRRRFQQLTGPVMAKSLEDTLFYRYGRLLALNEVGGDPGHFGVSPDAFHAANADRLRSWPHAMIATATHDTKRGEDARARLLALSEMPDRWAEAVARWEEITAHAAVRHGNGEAPDANDRYLILQQLLAAWPASLLEGDDSNERAAFRERMEGWVEKALREAKRHTSWVNQNEPYESAAKAFLGSLLEPGSRFLAEFRPLAAELALRGMVKGLARTVLKCTLPGVPDVYQGTEFWDLSLVDPDNRRPVDYAARRRALADDTPVADLLRHWPDGRLKQRVIATLLSDRARSPLLYADGDYRPVPMRGARARDLLAFERSCGGESLLVLVPRLTGEAEAGPPLRGAWDGTVVAATPGPWRDLLTGAVAEIAEGGHPAGELLRTLPIAVLRTHP